MSRTCANGPERSEGPGCAGSVASLWQTQLIERLDGVPGVESAAAAIVTVLSGSRVMSRASPDAGAEDESRSIFVRRNVVSETYLPTLGIPLLRGRDFAASDGPGSQRVAIVSQSLVDRLWPGLDPIGRTLYSSPAPAEVVGIVPDTVYASPLEVDAPPFFLVPLRQNYASQVSLHVRTTGDPLALMPTLRRVVRDIDPDIPVSNPRRLVDVWTTSIGEQRAMAMLLGLFSGLALLLAATGLYAIMAYTANQRRTEIGLRMALGATPAAILREVAGQGMKLVGLGAIFGVVGGYVVGRAVENRLFGVEPTDTMTWIAIVVLMLVIGATGTSIPAYRAMRTDPAATLRRS